MYRNALLPLTQEVALKRNHPSGSYNGYRKILVPLDGTEEAELVLVIAPEILAPGGEGILLRVIQPDKEEHVAQVIAGGYLGRVLTWLSGVSSGWRYEVIASGSVANGIADFAAQNQVDLIAMYTHDRKGLARLIKGNIAEKVQRLSAAEVRVLRPHDLVPGEGPTQ
ncbi:MAG: universal stress protein [Dehalococcoidia bacterium]